MKIEHEKLNAIMMNMQNVCRACALKNYHRRHCHSFFFDMEMGRGKAARKNITNANTIQKKSQNAV